MHKITHILAIHDNPKHLFQDKHYLCVMAADNPDQVIKQQQQQKQVIKSFLLSIFRISHNSFLSVMILFTVLELVKIVMY